MTMDQVTKTIEEMANILHQGMKPIKETYSTTELATILYNAGYRKESEVAKEIFDKIAKQLMQLKIFPGLEYVSIKTAALIEISNEYKEKARTKGAK